METFVIPEIWYEDREVLAKAPTPEAFLFEGSLNGSDGRTAVLSDGDDVRFRVYTGYGVRPVMFKDGQFLTDEELPAKHNHFAVEGVSASSLGELASQLPNGLHYVYVGAWSDTPVVYVYNEGAFSIGE